MKMTLTIPETDPLATCQCGHKSYGDSMNDAVLAWTAHVAQVHGREEW